MNKYVIGIDFGTDSVRSVIIDTKDGKEISTSVFYYPRWKEGKFCSAIKNQFRQHPLDYIEGLEQTIKDCLNKAEDPEVKKSIVAISVDTTGSTPVAVNRSGVPLSLLPEFEDNPNAMFFLWKDHSAIDETVEINEHAKKFDVNYLQFVGGTYSSEWFWAKLLYVLRIDEEVRRECYSWVEHSDWIPFLLTGGKDVHEMKRNRCTAGHKSLWAPEFDGLPPESFFASLDPLLVGFTSKLFKNTYTSDQAAGTLSNEWALRLNLSSEVLVGIGAMDAHMGAVGGQITPYYLSKIMGTSTCDMLVVPNTVKEKKNLIKGICGQVHDSIIPGMIGMEAGQSAFGDTYAWFKDLLLWPLRNLTSCSDSYDQKDTENLLNELSDQIIPELSRQASRIPLTEKNVYAVDWFNGRRTPDANQQLKGAIFDLTLGSNAPNIFNALVEATCFGSKKIVETFLKQGIPIKGIIALGGISKKSPFIMQMMSDVLNLPIKVHRSEQSCALGAGMYAATVAGVYSKVEEAMNAMGQGFDAEYCPQPDRVDVYKIRYQNYLKSGSFLEKK